MTTIGLVLSGCGYLDGSEVQESLSCMLALEQAGASLQYFAPDSPQKFVTDHQSGEARGEVRNVLTEAARISRGNVRKLSEAQAAELDGLVIPGGFGAAQNLCSFATSGQEMTVRDDLRSLLVDLHTAGKPIGAVCISPVILAKVFGEKGPQLTIGDDRETATAIESWGAQHVSCKVQDCIVDEANRLVTSPAYMYDTCVKDVFTGVTKLVKEVMRLAN